MWISKSCLKLLPALLILTQTISNAEIIDRLAAVVNGEIILQSDLDRFSKTFSLRQELDPLLSLKENFNPTSREQALDYLIEERLIFQAHKISDSDVDSEIANVRRANSLSQEELETFLRQKGLRFNDYFEMMRSGLAKRALKETEIQNRINITDADVRNYFVNSFAKQETAPLEYAFHLFTFSADQFSGSTTQAEHKANEALRALKQGKTLREVAKQFTDEDVDENEKSYISLSQLTPSIKALVRPLNIGQTSSVVRSDNTYLFVKILDIRSADTERFNEVKDKIRETLAKEQFRKQFQLWVDRARSVAYLRVIQP